jgi:hypothetical protein
MGCGVAVFFAGTAIGNFAIGYAAEHLGAPVAVRCCGIMVIAISAVIIINRKQLDTAIEKAA